MFPDVRNTKTSYNMETINCESYMSRLLKTDKQNSLNKVSVGNVPKPKPPSVKSSSYQTGKPKPIVRHSPAVKPNGPPPGSANSKEPGLGNSNILHKEVFGDNSALVEVTVKTTKPRNRTTTQSDREPWAQLLKNQQVVKDDKSTLSFSHFDPLRTIHFLAKELQYKLQNNNTDDSGLQHIIMDMQRALKRVPPEIASTIHLQQISENALRKSHSSQSLVDQKPEKLVHALKPSCNEISSQTVQKYEDTEYLQKVMEESTVKLEASCRQMEMLCGRLKSEKEEVERQLQIEKECNIQLQKRIAELEIQAEQSVDIKLEAAENEKKELQTKVEKLTDIIESQSNQSVAEIKALTNELNTLKAKTEQETARLKHQITLCNMEKEKYVAILEVRDRQICEIRSEMSQLQEVVNEQLMEIHNSALSAAPSSISTVGQEEWNNILKDTKINLETSAGGKNEWKDNISEKDDTISSITTTSPAPDSEISKGIGPNSGIEDAHCELPPNKQDDVFDKNSKGDPIFSLSKQCSSTSLTNSLKSQCSIRDMFAELKKQAFSIPTSHSRMIHRK